MNLIEKVQYLQGVEKIINDIFSECEDWEKCEDNEELTVQYEQRLEEMEHDFRTFLPTDIDSMICYFETGLFEHIGGAFVIVKFNYEDDNFNIDYTANVEF